MSDISEDGEGEPWEEIMKRPWHKISASFLGQLVLISLLFLDTLFSASNVHAEASLLQLEWRYGIYSEGIGASSINVFDIDGDGSKEMVMGGSTYYFWYVVKQTGADVYDQVWVSEMYSSAIARIIVSDINSDGISEIYIGLTDGTVMAYDGRTMQETGSFTAESNISAMAIADADGDGKKEIVISDGSKIYVYSADSFDLEWKSDAYGGSSIAVGNVDTDPAPEIITTTDGGHGYVIDGASHALEWDYINGFGNLIKLGDIDGDTMSEIIGAKSWQKITCFDADIKSPKWEITTDLDITALTVTDTDGDGIPEVVYGDGQWGAIHCYDAVTHAEKWHINNPEHGVTDIALGDVDHDGVSEVIWGAGASSTGPDYLFIADTVTHQIEWQSVSIDGPLSAVDVGDVDDDGRKEIVMVSFGSKSGYDSGVIHIFDAVTHELEWRHTLDNMDWMGVRSVKIGDVDNDGETEFVLTTGNIYYGIIQVYNGSTYTLERQSAGYDGNYFTALAIGDVDNDGKTEIVAGQGVEHTGADGTHLIVFDGSSLEEKWKSVSLGSNFWGKIYDIKLADVDNDGHIEIIAAVNGQQIYVFDGVTHQLKWLAAVPAYALEVSDINFDKKKEILIGRADGVIDVYDGATFSLIDSFALCSGPIYGLLIDDIKNNGKYRWLVSEAPDTPWTGASTVSVFDGATKALLWREDNLGKSVGNFNHLIAVDLDDDQRKEIVFGSSYALHQFEVSSANILIVTKSGTGSGTVTSTPAGINCGTECSETYEKTAKPKNMKLKVKPDAYSTFLGWGGDCQASGTKTICTVKMDSDKNVTASFGVPDVSVSPTYHDFGSVVVKQSSSPGTFTIQNNGTGNLMVTKVNITGTDAKMFKKKGGSKKTIGPGGTYAFTVTFKPTSAGIKSATLQIQSNDPDTPTIEIPMSGTAHL